MLEGQLRQAANLVLESAIRLAPLDVRGWGQAMRGELDYVEGAWASVIWAFGGLTVLAKEALISLLMPGRRGQVVPPGRGLFARSVSLRKVALVAGAAYVLGALIFFAAPPFRQGLRVSLTAWKQLFQVAPPVWNSQPGLRALAKRAEARQDAEGLAFVAARLLDGRESVRLAEEAVRLDSDFLWVYAIVAVHHPELAEISRWTPELERWDPQNALPYLIAAEGIDITLGNEAAGLPPNEQAKAQDDPAWQAAMAAAFASPKFDDYLDRLKDLDGSVVRRYGFNDPYAVLYGENVDLPTYAFSDSQRFAGALLQSGQNLEARGEHRPALEKYWAVLRFGEVVDSQSHVASERMGLHLQVMAYRQLQALAEKKGNADEDALFGYLAAKFEPARAEQKQTHDEAVFHHQILRRNALVLQLSGLLSVVFSCLLAIALSILRIAQPKMLPVGDRRAI